MSHERTGLKTHQREYRQLVHTDLVASHVTVQQTDLSIYADMPVRDIATEAVLRQRGILEFYIQQWPEFESALHPWQDDLFAPQVVRQMILAGRAASVGPMAAVAGAIAEQVGQSLRQSVSEVIVENGGDIYIDTKRSVTVGIFAGKSPLSLKVGLRIASPSEVKAVCTSSGTVGHSLSLGKADAVCVLSGSCALADAVATALGNRISRVQEIPDAIRWGQRIHGVLGLLVVMDDQMGAWGAVEIVPLRKSA